MINTISISGGKDSTATWLLALERDTENIQPLFCDTGHEHTQTYEYIDYLESNLGKVLRLKADFAEKIMRKRETIKSKWVKDGVSDNKICEALEFLHPTGNPFLDLCLWKGRFPSTRARFCTQELKHIPIERHIKQLLIDVDEVRSWVGIRAEESIKRAMLTAKEDHPTIQGLETYRPILKWSTQQVFEIHKKHNIKPNPLYQQGMGRVGCMPCIHCSKDELRQVAQRFPTEIERIRRWEQLVSQTSKRGCSTLFAAINGEISPIDKAVSWSRTAYGGRQYDLLHHADILNYPVCESRYGLCE